MNTLMWRSLAMGRDIIISVFLVMVVLEGSVRLFPSLVSEKVLLLFNHEIRQD